MSRPHPETSSRQLSIKRLELENFRCFGNAVVEFHPELTVLVAENAQGKSAVLSAASLALGPVISELGGVRPQPLTSDTVRVAFASNEHMQPCLPMRLKAGGEVRGVDLVWSRTRTSVSAHAGASRKELMAALAEARELRRLAQADGACLLPVAAFYRTDRLWSSLGGESRRIRTDRRIQGRWLGYADWTSPTSSFNAFLAWYRGAFTQLGLATSKFNDAGSRLEKQIVAVHEAVRTALQPTGWTNINWERAGDSTTPVMGRDFISIEHRSRGRLPLQFLSDGIQNMVALVADLAYRCVVLNPHLGESAARETCGVVLIDEIDMHLHPRWQQVVVELIRKAFPKIQFIVTTHSPQVLSTVDNESIRLIRLDGAAASVAKPRYQSRGIESADILARLMDVDPIPQVEEAKWLSEYRALIQLSKQQSPEGTALWEKIVSHFGADNPVLSEIAVLRRFQEFRATHGLTGGGKAEDAEA